MALYTTGAAELLRHEDGALVVRPVARESVAFLTTTVVTTQGNDYRIPIVATDPNAAWVAEGAEIPTSDADVTETKVTPKKVAGLSIISVELASDSNPAAAETVGQGLARDIAKKVDAAFFADTTTNGPSGLGSLTTSTVDTGGTITNTDPFSEAISKAEQVGAQLTSFVAHPNDLLTMAKIKKMSGSNETLLAPNGDATLPARYQVAGVPLIASPAVTEGTIWGIPQAFVTTVLRSGTTITADSSVFFTSDRVAIRAIMRVGFGFPHPLAIVKLADATP
mgnify:CR=1 FL=1